MATATDDIKFTPPVETGITTMALTDLLLHTDEGFPGGPNKCFVLTVDDIISTPYIVHKVHHEFDDTSLFFDYLR